MQRALEIPRALRAFVRARESSLVVVAAAVGGLAGLGVVAMSFATNLLHWLFFRIPWGQRLSAADWVDPTLAIAVPTIGGLLFGLGLVLVARWRPLREVDPIEANALHGGRMSLRGSLNVVLQTIWSCGVGASVGLKQVIPSSAVASRPGSARRFICAGKTCGFWLAAAPPGPSLARSERRSRAPSMALSL
jgi:CIC family chloride channel protein